MLVRFPIILQCCLLAVCIFASSAPYLEFMAGEYVDFRISLLHDGDADTTNAPVPFLCHSLKETLWSNVDKVITVFDDQPCVHLLPGLEKIPPTRVKIDRGPCVIYVSEPIDCIVRLFYTVQDQIGMLDGERFLRCHRARNDEKYLIGEPFKGESPLLNLPDELIEHILKLTVRVHSVEVALLNCVCRAFRNKSIYYKLLTDIDHQCIDSLRIYHPVLVSGFEDAGSNSYWLRETWLPFLYKRIFLGEHPRFATFTRLQSDAVFTRLLNETCKRMNLETIFALKLKKVAEPLLNKCVYSDEARELVQLMKPVILGMVTTPIFMTVTLKIVSSENLPLESLSVACSVSELNANLSRVMLIYRDCLENYVRYTVYCIVLKNSFVRNNNSPNVLFTRKQGAIHFGRLFTQSAYLESIKTMLA